MTDTHMSNDPLLKAARLISIVLRWILLLAGGVILAIGVLGLLAIAVQEAGLIAIADPLAVPDDIIAVVIFVCIGVGCFLLARFLKKLLEIIATVADGNPFEIANAARLETMGWLVAGATLLSFLGELFGRVYNALALAAQTDFEVEGSVEGVLITLLLFILARVFRHGAAMREDLEGTV